MNKEERELPEFYAQMIEKAAQFMEEHNDQRAQTSD